MITRIQTAGGWYCDATPEGASVVLCPLFLETDRGMVLPPPGQSQLLFPRLARDGIRIAGQGAEDNLAWLWSGSGWSSHGVAFGVSPCIFDKDDNLVVAHAGGVTGSQGWRYLADDGTLVTGDSTFEDAAHGLYEWTAHGDVTIGQGGDEEGCQAIVAGRRVLLEAGVCRSIRFRREGDALAVAFYKTPGPTSAILRFSRADLDALPTYVRPVAIPAIGRPMWNGFLNFLPHATPGNCVVNVSDMVMRDAKGAAVAIFVEGQPDGDLGAINRAIAAAKSRGLPIVAYWPKALQKGPLPTGMDWLGVEAYCFTDSLAAFEARVRAAVARHPKVMLVCQCYDNGAPTTPLTSLVPVYARIAKDCKNVGGLLVFSGYGRATGLQDHPEVLPLWQQLAAGIPSAPSAVPPATPLTITITDYNPKAGPAPLKVRAVRALSGTGAKSVNWRWRSSGGTWNPPVVNDPADPDHTFTFSQPGVYEIGVDVIDQAGHVANGTKTPRFVEVRG